ncbi:MAG: hypothetical protein II719_07400, partial [Clostridia bacterium]|nr:hypothetical protein [Clostridia bacterium]
GLTGELINDTTFNRNLMVEERFGVRVESVFTPNHNADLAKISAAGDTSFDMVYGVAALMAGDLLQGYALNLVDLPFVDFSQGYWYPSTIEGLSCYGKVYHCPSDITPSVLRWTYVVFFNKRILADYDLESPYELVYGNRWTLDNYISMIRQVSKDLNGDGIMDDKDLYGISIFDPATINTFVQLVWGAGEKMTTLQEDGSRAISLNGERVQKIIDTAGEVLKDPSLALRNSLYKDESWPNEEDSPYFEQGHALFEQISISFMERTGREMEDDYGVVPIPKYDADQENYYHRGWDLSGMFAVPSCVADPEKVGAIFTYMTWLSNQMMLPAYYDINIQQKRTRDEDSFKMLDLIRNTVYFDFCEVYDTYIPNYLVNAFQAGSFSRVFEGSLKKMTKELDRLTKKLNELD